MNDRYKTTFKYGILFVFIAILIYACLMNFGSVLNVLSKLLEILMPLLTGLMIAIVLNVPMGGIQKLTTKILNKCGKKGHEGVINAFSLILTLVLVILLIVLVFSVVIPQLVESIKSIIETFKNYYPTLIKELKHLGIDTSRIETFMDIINFDQLINTITSNADTIVNTTFSAASSIVSTVANSFVGLIIAIYLLASKKKLGQQSKKMLYAYLKKPVADKICSIATLSNKTFARFFSGQFLEACILGLLVFLCMSICGLFGYSFPYASVISLFVGFMQLIPYVGAFTSMAVGFLLILMVDPMKAVVFAIMLLIIQQVEGQLIYPRVVGSSVGLPAIWTLLAAMVGGAIFGIFGIIFFIPLTSILYSLLKDDMNERLIKKDIKIS